MSDGKLLVIGCGNIGGAIIDGVIKAESYLPENVICCDTDARKLSELERTHGVKIISNATDGVDQVSVVLLAVKPNLVKKVLDGFCEKVRGRKDLLIVSVAAGVKVETISLMVGSEVAVTRVMPNLPCTIGKGISAIYGIDEKAVLKTEELFEAVGECVIVKSEAELDAVTGLSGSGPGFVFTIIEALAQGGVRMGLSPVVAGKLAAVTVYGAAAMLLQSEEHPAVLRDKVTTPGGTTIAGLQALEDGGLRSALIAAVEAATLRAKELD